MEQTYPELNKEARKSVWLLKTSMAKRSTWDQRNARYTRMYLGQPYTADELNYFAEMKRFPININICAPIIDAYVSLLCANSPQYKAIPATNRFVKEAAAANFILEYNAYISKFPHEFLQTMYDYAMTGIGWMQTDIDPTLDFGNGEVLNRNNRWTDVHWDWRSRRPGLQDRAWTIVYKELSGSQIKAMFPKSNALVERAKTICKDDLDLAKQILVSIPINNERENNAKAWGTELMLIGDIYADDMPSDGFGTDDRLLPVIERYETVYQKFWSVFDPGIGYTQYLDKKTFEEKYVARAEDPVYRKIVMQSYEITMPRVRRVITLGGLDVLDDIVLPISYHPVVPFVKMSTGSAYPLGIMSRLEDIQHEQNYRRMAINENAAASASGRMLAPRGSIDRNEWMIYSRLPGGLIEYKTGMDMQREAFIQLTPQPLPNQFFFLDQQQIPLGQFVTGVDPSMMSSAEMPDTYRQSLMAEEQGQRRIKAVDLSSIEASLEKLGQVTLEYDQWWYNAQKKLSILDDGGVLRELVLNKAVLDGENRIIARENDIRNSKFEVRIISGSTLPRSRYALLELYLSLFDRGLIDDVEVLKQTDILDIEGVLNRTGQIAKASEAIQGMQEQLKQMDTIIKQLKNQLMQAEIKMGSQEYLNMMELATLQRQMQERLGKALTDLSAREFVKDVKREERYLSEMANLRTRNLLDLAKAKVAGAVNRQTASSKNG
jgi:hypothetical protein